ncbi:UDP-glucose 6-dehydrogenase TuaD [Marinicrinis lubricantis]|uniref:UDP-glucose 6-dehydrogenase n=1 Tax=Marinicrinis lubricantis TaxID=2086470 RepID=A0ABW1IPS2_9BACL
MKKITVIGTGYVGLVSGTSFADIGNEVICCDIDSNKIEKLKQGFIPIYEPGLEEVVKKNTQLGRLSFTTDIPGAIRSSDIIYIAVGTPMSVTGAADLRFVTEAAKTIGQHLNDYKVVVNKSTVPVGTGKLVQRMIQSHLSNPHVTFDVVSNPEFLREGSALKDCMNMERAVIGATSEKAASIIAELHKPFNTEIVITTLESAEMIKYASNAFLATKISFINAVANICERVGADVTEVSRGMGLDSRIGSRFLNAGIGYGGSCFPKDTHALVHIAESAGYDFHLMKSVIRTNDQQRLVVVDKVKEVLGSLRGRTIAVLGLAFKPNTDDMRDAPSLQIIPALLREGAKIKAYDPIAAKEAVVHFGDQIEYVEEPYDTILNADAALILTEWEQVVSMDPKQMRKLMNMPVVIDGRNIFSPKTMQENGFIYHSIGRPPIHPEA